MYVCIDPFIPSSVGVACQVLVNNYPDKDNLWAHCNRLKFIPFNPSDKFTMAVIQDQQTGKVRFQSNLRASAAGSAVHAARLVALTAMQPSCSCRGCAPCGECRMLPNKRHTMREFFPGILQVFRVMKGAPQVVLKRAHDYDEIHEAVDTKITEYASRCAVVKQWRSLLGPTCHSIR
jgi:magnesium-transporting ATPase (P-type)